jgi:hypothetical protein
MRKFPYQTPTTVNDFYQNVVVQEKLAKLLNIK